MPFEVVAAQLAHVIARFFECGYFNEAFGDGCVDSGPEPGTLGPGPGVYVFTALRRENLWPMFEMVPVSVEHDGSGLKTTKRRWEMWDQDEWFDMVELFHDLVSKPTNGWYHDFSGCGWHFGEFSTAEGQREFRDEINYILSLGDPVYVIDGEGEITVKAPEEFETLLRAGVPDGTNENTVTAKMESAKRSFRSRSATKADRQHAVNDLAAGLEILRDQMKEVMLKDDESALFKIANNFGIRHNSRKQKIDYDDETWLRWLFCVYLATIHAVLRIQARQPKEDPNANWVAATLKD